MTIIGPGITISNPTVAYQNSPIVVGNVPVQLVYTNFITETLSDNLITENGYQLVEEN